MATNIYALCTGQPAGDVPCVGDGTLADIVDDIRFVTLISDVAEACGLPAWCAARAEPMLLAVGCLWLYDWTQHLVANKGMQDAFMGCLWCFVCGL